MSNLIVMNNEYDDDLALDVVMGYCAGETVPWHKCQFYGGLGVDTVSIYQMISSMKYVKEYYNQTSGKQLYHFVFNIKIPYPNGCTKPEKVIKDEKEGAGNIMAAVSNFIWQRGYQNSVFLHVDTKIPHVHMVLNSVNRFTGNKIRNIGGLAKELLYFLRGNYRNLHWSNIVYKDGKEI